MGYLFKKHYTREEARGLLPSIRQWLQSLAGLRRQLNQYDQRLAALLSAGHDAGGETANQWAKALTDSKEILSEFQRRESRIKDLDRRRGGFPDLRSGKGVC